MELDAIQKYFNESAAVMKQFGEDQAELIKQAHELVVETAKNGNTVFFAGNGGSAADAQHMAAEFTGRFETNYRIPLPAIALTTDTSALTAIANDYGYEYVFSRQLKALGKPGDLFIGISTSGNSGNIIEAVQVGKNRDIKTLGLLGKDGGKLKDLFDLAVVVPHERTAYIQQVHEAFLHTVCVAIDDEFRTDR